jgi:hypothetical protein
VTVVLIRYSGLRFSPSIMKLHQPIATRQVREIFLCKNAKTNSIKILGLRILTWRRCKDARFRQLKVIRNVFLTVCSMCPIRQNRVSAFVTLGDPLPSFLITHCPHTFSIFQFHSLFLFLVVLSPFTTTSGREGVRE